VKLLAWQHEYFLRSVAWQPRELTDWGWHQELHLMQHMGRFQVPTAGEQRGSLARGISSQLQLPVQDYGIGRFKSRLCDLSA
jgi:hypothetical protein